MEPQADGGGQSTTGMNKRMKWSKEDNVLVMKCYYEAGNSYGYRKRMLTLYNRSKPNNQLSEQHLMSQKRAIITKKLLSDLELEQIQRSINQDTDTIQEEEETPVLTDRRSLQQEEEDQITEQVAEDIDRLSQEEVKIRQEVLMEMAEESPRMSLPKLKMTSKVKEQINQMNEIIKTIKTTNLEETNKLIYIIAAKTIGMLGMKTVESNMKKKEPFWKRRIKQTKERLRKDAAQLNRIVRKEMELPTYLKNKYKISKTKTVNTAYEEAKQRLTATTTKLQRYTDREEQYKQNHLFMNNPKQFYRNLRSPPRAHMEQEEQTPNKEELKQFWDNIWSREKHHNQGAKWIRDIRGEFNHVNQQNEIVITTADVRRSVAMTSNWKSTGPDQIHNFWLKHLTETHSKLADNFNHILQTNDAPRWLTTGTTHLLRKSLEKPGSDPSNYRPITCLNTTWKLLTSIITKTITNHLKDNNLIAEEQKGNKSETKGTKDHLLMDKTTVKDAKRRKTNLSMCWIDYKKAFDSVPHSWIIETLKMHKINDKIIELIRTSMGNWNTTLKINNKTVHETDIRRGIFQGDSMSPLLFCLALNPLSYLLKRTNKGYNFKEGSQINHLMYMDDIKLFAKNPTDMNRLVQTTQIFSQDIGMSFGYDKCATVNMQRGKLHKKAGIQLEEGNIEELTDKPYKYLGIEEIEDIQHGTTKEKVRKEFITRTKKIYQSKLSGHNKVTAYNQYAVPVIQYSAGIIDWTKEEILELDRKSRKIMNMNKSLHPRADIHRLYVTRDKGGRGIRSIEDVIIMEQLKLKEYVETECDWMMREVNRSQILDNQQTGGKPSPTTYKATRIDEHVNGWMDKPMHGQFRKQLGEEVDKELTYAWLKKAHLKSPTEALITAAQDQAINTNYHSAKILKQGNSAKCRLCKTEDETIQHIISGCEILANKEYKNRHNTICRYVHWILSKENNLEHTEQWWKHKPQPSAENEQIKLLYDFNIFTDKEIQARRPDVVVHDKQNRRVTIIDVACPIDTNITKKETEKIMKYQDLKIEIEKMWNVRGKVIPIVVGALGAVTKALPSYCALISRDLDVQTVQKSTLLGTSHIIRKVLQL